MDSDEPPPFTPPWPSGPMREAMCRESADSDPEGPLGPLASSWIEQLTDWYSDLQSYFEFDPSDLVANVRKSVARWIKSLSYLTKSDPGLFDSIMDHLFDLGRPMAF